jgi:hypothetical protein
MIGGKGVALGLKRADAVVKTYCLGWGVGLEEHERIGGWSRGLLGVGGILRVRRRNSRCKRCFKVEEADF